MRAKGDEILAVEDTLWKQENILREMNPPQFTRLSRMASAGEQQQRILGRMASAYIEIPQISAMLSQSSLSIASACANVFATPDYIAGFRSSLTALCSPLPWQDDYGALVRSASAGLNAITEQLATLSISTNFSFLSESVWTTVEKAFELAAPYIPAEQRREYEEELVPQLEAGKPRTLSLDMLLKIFGALTALLALIFAIMPNAQQAKIIEQNDELIALEEERVELERQRGDDLQNVVYALADAINSLSNEITELRELAEDSNDSDVPPSQDGESNGENQNGD